MTWGWHKWPFVEATKDEKRHRTKAVKATKDERTLKEAACRRLGRRCEGQILKTLRIFVCCHLLSHSSAFPPYTSQKFFEFLFAVSFPPVFWFYITMSRIPIIPPSAWSQNHDQSSGTRQPQSQCVSLQNQFFLEWGGILKFLEIAVLILEIQFWDVFGTLNLCVEPQFQPYSFSGGFPSSKHSLRRGVSLPQGNHHLQLLGWQTGPVS